MLDEKEKRKKKQKNKERVRKRKRKRKKGVVRERISRLASEGSAGRTKRRCLTSPGLPPMADRLISNFKSNKNDS